MKYEWVYNSGGAKALVRPGLLARFMVQNGAEVSNSTFEQIVRAEGILLAEDREKAAQEAAKANVEDTRESVQTVRSVAGCDSGEQWASA